MKKVFLSVALALAVAGSWAFYPKAAAEPGGYMMVVGRLSGRGNGLQLIAVDGQLTSQPLAEKGLNEASLLALHQAEAVALNRLRANGWEVVSTYSTLLFF